MVICPNCQKELADGSKFCDTCGTKIEAIEETVVTPSASEPEYDIVSGNFSDLDATVAATPSFNYEPAYNEQPAFDPADPVPGNDVPDYDPMINDAPEIKPEDTKKSNKKMLAILFAALGGVLAVILIVILIVALGGNKGNNYALYYKDDEVNFTKLPTVKSWEVSDNDGYYAKLTPDGKYIVYINDSDDDQTLCIRSASNKKKEAIEIKDDVIDYMISDDSKFIAFKANGNLYEYNIAKDADVKVKNDISDYYIMEDSNALVYYKETSDDLYDYYVKTLGKDNEEKVGSDVSDIDFIDTDCKKYYFIEDETLYLGTLGKDEEEIDDDVNYITAAFEDGSVYYKKYDQDDDSYSLYYYKGKDEVIEVFSDCDYIIIKACADETPVAVFDVTEDWEDDESIAYVVSYGNISELDHDDGVSYVISEDGTVLYYLADVNYKKSSSKDNDDEEDSEDDEGDFESATLYYAKLTKNGISKVTEYDTEVYQYIYLLDNKTVVYFKDYDLKDEVGTLYVNKKLIDEEVDFIYVRYVDTNTFIYTKDLKEGACTLYVCKDGKKSVKVDDDVYAAAFTGKGDVIYIKDYDEYDEEGDLFFFKGNKSKEIDTDVSNFIRDTYANELLN